MPLTVGLLFPPRVIRRVERVLGCDTVALYARRFHFPRCFLRSVPLQPRCHLMCGQAPSPPQSRKHGRPPVLGERNSGTGWCRESPPTWRSTIPTAPVHPSPSFHSEDPVESAPESGTDGLDDSCFQLQEMCSHDTVLPPALRCRPSWIVPFSGIGGHSGFFVCGPRPFWVGG